MNLCYIEDSFNHINLLRIFTKSHINIIEIKSIDDLKSEDILIISNECSNYEQIVNKFPNIIIWQDIFNDFYDYSLNRYMSNYDFYYLKYSLKMAMDFDVTSLIVGSSYARYGIEEDFLSELCINLSLASQDIYYACLIGKHVISRNTNIKKIFMGTGYYSFNFDLSCTKGAELMRISDVYYPIFEDANNCEVPSKSQKSILVDNNIFDVRSIVDLFCDDIFKQSRGKYFNDERSRTNLNIISTEIGNSKWCKLDYSLKKRYSYERAESHNKLIKYSDTYKKIKKF